MNISYRKPVVAKLREFALEFFPAMRKPETSWFKKLKGTNGIYEFRIDESNKFYRLFAFWDKEGKTETLIVGTHGIAKKTNKTPANEIGNAGREN